MPRYKPRKEQIDALEREDRITNALKQLELGKFPSIRKAASAYNLSHAVLARRLNGTSQNRALAHTHRQLLTPSEEQCIVQWILKLKEWGFPPRIEHVKEAVIILKNDAYTKQHLDEELQHDPAFKTVTPGRNWIGKFLNRHPELVSKFSAQFDKKRLKANDPTLIEDHFRKIRLIRKKFHITDARMYNMDEKGFRQGISDRAKVICRRRARGATGKVAQDGNKELSTVVEAIDGIGNVLPPLVIFKGKVFTAGWLQTIVRDLNRLDNYKDWKLTHSESG